MNRKLNLKNSLFFLKNLNIIIDLFRVKMIASAPSIALCHSHLYRLIFIPMLLDSDNRDEWSNNNDSSEITPFMSTPEVVEPNIEAPAESLIVRRSVSQALDDRDNRLQGALRYLNVREVERLLVEGTYRSTSEALTILKKLKLLGYQRWNSVHVKGEHCLSHPELGKVNPLAYKISKKIKPGDKIMELGCGFGNDAIFMAQAGAQVQAVEISDRAILFAKKNAKKILGEKSDQIDFIHQNFLTTLNGQAPHSLDKIYSNSTLHYYPDRYFEEQLKLIFEALKRGSRGRLFLAMKLANSASAQSSEQIHLNIPNSGYLHAIDGEDGILRIFPRNIKALLNSLRPYFVIESSEVVSVPDYDRKGAVEIFAQVVAAPKYITLA